MTGMDLVEFLTARLDEYEQVARAAAADGDGWKLRAHESDYWLITDASGEVVVYDEGSPTEPQAEHIVRHGPARVLADIAAKRRMVQQFAEDAAGCPEDDWPEEGDMSAAPVADHARWALRCLALPDADHPDYRQEWRP